MKVFIFSFLLLALIAVAFAVTECPSEDGDYAVHLKNPSNCSTYYKCSAGEAILQDCPTGLEWNDSLEVCDWPSDAGCTVDSE